MEMKINSIFSEVDTTTENEHLTIEQYLNKYDINGLWLVAADGKHLVIDCKNSKDAKEQLKDCLHYSMAYVGSKVAIEKKTNRTSFIGIILCTDMTDIDSEDDDICFKGDC